MTTPSTKELSIAEIDALLERVGAAGESSTAPAGVDRDAWDLHIRALDRAEANGEDYSDAAFALAADIGQNSPPVVDSDQAALDKAARAWLKERGLAMTAENYKNAIAGVSAGWNS